MPHNHEELLKHVKADMPSDELLQDMRSMKMRCAYVRLPIF